MIPERLSSVPFALGRRTDEGIEALPGSDAAVAVAC